MIQIGFHGAAKTVTGSNYFIKTDNGNFVVDCGMFQGPDVEGRNLEPYAYNPAEADFALLTHAHIDHSGMLPKLYKGGFRGRIYATNHTIQISNLLLMDSAKIQENNFKLGEPYGKYTNQVALVYNTYDAEETTHLFESVHFEDEFEPLPGIKVKFIRAGHILGAASIEVTIKDGDGWKKIMFSGDIGRLQSPLIETFDTEYKSDPDYVLIESLYGSEVHPNRNDNVEDMIKVINETIEKGGNVFIPTFSVQRTQEVLHDLKTAQEEGKLDKDQPVWLDSPLAQKVSYIYLTALTGKDEALFTFDSLRFVKKAKQSYGLTKQKGQIILAGSGMADGGRIMHHLQTGLDNPKNTIIFVGYQADGTLGRELKDGAKEVMVEKTKVNVKARIVAYEGFSAHGDSEDYKAWIQRFNTDKLKNTFLIHAEEDRAEAFDKELDKIGITKSHIPDWKEEVKLS
ncbi:MBL fold metallo-hydrolase [Candidatus Dojkabacteria bacterium]|uniref:MBL fold metallo-hydrolase n=1 Tax=Candidatus Dojkabacteria bacterium TaxID=2099670 RepID=A0A955RLF6_9BACT|nr:MBL fold metallo-hydrolase [Candidatus Dojkabacteria bacterium]